MILALILFAVTYVLMLRLQQYRPWVALCSAVLFIVLGEAGVYEFSLRAALQAVDYNVLLMMAGTMGTVALFIESKMPARLAEMLIVRVPDVKWAVCMLALFAGVISAFVDNVATVLMVAPVGLAIARKLKISPVPVLIAIAVSSNLQARPRWWRHHQHPAGQLCRHEFLRFLLDAGPSGHLLGRRAGRTCFAGSAAVAVPPRDPAYRRKGGD